MKGPKDLDWRRKAWNKRNGIQKLSKFICHEKESRLFSGKVA